MANAEETPNTDIIFRGIDGNECEAFVVAIRDLAFAKGKDEDPNWMLRYATTRLRGKALRWQVKLDPSIRKDWNLFTQALFEEYPFVEEGDERGIATPAWTSTTFSPAPSTITLPGNDRHLTTAQPKGSEVVPPGTAQASSSPPPGGELAPPTQLFDPLLPGHQMGRLLVVYEEGRQGPHYISASPSRATRNIQEALIVTFIPSSEAHLIGIFGEPDRTLSVRLCSPEGSKLHQLDRKSSLDKPIEISPGSFQEVSNIWNILPDGTLSATLPDLTPVTVTVPDSWRSTADQRRYVPSGYRSATTVYVHIAGTSISFARDSDHSTPRIMCTSSGLPFVRARIVFQPL